MPGRRFGRHVHTVGVGIERRDCDAACACLFKLDGASLNGDEKLSFAEPTVAVEVRSLCHDTGGRRHARGGVSRGERSRREGVLWHV